MFSIPTNNVRCIYVEGSGCYGRNGHEDAAADAALLAKAVERPVRVQWSRADEHGWEFGWVFRRHVAQRRLSVLLPFRIGIVDEVLAELIA
jgi:CO/xanthine dehydrogenase Mo-binding subunit